MAQRGRGSALVLVVGVWALAGLALLFCTPAIVYRFSFFLFLPLAITFALIGVGLTVVMGMVAWTTRRRADLCAAGAPAAFALLAWLFGGVVMAAGDAALFRLHFETNRSRFEQVAEALEAGRLSCPAFEQLCEVDQVLVDPGPPTRLAFARPGGIIDNWEGVIYDPSDEVTRATGWTAEGRLSAGNLVNLFGGSLVWCEHVERHFYRCGFT